MRRSLTTFMAASLLSTLEGVNVATRGLGTVSNRGAFILFEGVDRCGKTTQVGMLKDHYAKTKTTEQIRFPERKSAVANRWEQSDSIESKLASGCNLICDRYAYSGVAFTSSKGLDLDWCKACDRGLPAPDCVIYLDIPVEDAALRGNFGEERYEKIDFQKKVREQFMHLKAEDAASGAVNWHVVDARQSIEEVHSQIVRIVDQTMAAVGDKAVSKLWVK